jgi:hypothetical protein
MKIEEYTPSTLNLGDYFDADLLYAVKKKEVEFHISALRDSYVMTTNDPAYGLCQSGGNVEARALDAIEWEMELKNIERRTSKKRQVLNKALAMMDEESQRILRNGYNKRFTSVSADVFGQLQREISRNIGKVLMGMDEGRVKQEKIDRKRRANAFRRGEDIA